MTMRPKFQMTLDRESDSIERKARRELKSVIRAKRKAEHEWRRESRAAMEQRWAEGARS